MAAAVDAMASPEFSLHAITVSTMGAAVLVIVNGPVAVDLGINSGVSVFGPGNRANASIGRAIRLIIINVLGTRAGDLDKATIGHPGKYTWCIAESEELSPWEPLHVTRGLPQGSSAVTVASGLGPFQIAQHHDDSPERILDAFVDPLFGMGPLMKEVLVILSPEHLEHFRAAGWEKGQIGEYLHDKARRPASAWAVSGRSAPRFVVAASDTVIHLAPPEALLPIVSGGGRGARLRAATWTTAWRSGGGSVRGKALSGHGEGRSASNGLIGAVLIGAFAKPLHLAFQGCRVYTGCGTCCRSRGECSGESPWAETERSLLSRGQPHPADGLPAVQYRRHGYTATTTKRISSNTPVSLDCHGRRDGGVDMVLFNGSGDTAVSTYVVRTPRTWVG